MEQIGIHLRTFRRPVNSKRAYCIEQLMIFMGENPTDSKRFGYWCGRTKKISPNRVLEMMSESKSGRNPKALFCWLLKREVPKQVSLFQ